MIDSNTVVQDSEPEALAGEKGVGGIVVWNDAGTRKLCIRIDGVQYGVNLTAL